MMKNMAMNLGQQAETIKKIKQAPVEISEFKNLMRILNKIKERERTLDDIIRRKTLPNQSKA